MSKQTIYINGEGAFTMLGKMGPSVCRLFDYILNHLTDSYEFVSNDASRARICEKMQIKQSTYYSHLKKLKDANVLVPSGRDAYKLNNNLLKIRVEMNYTLKRKR